MRVKVIRNFYDKEAHLALRSEGSEIEVPEARGKQLIEMKFAERLLEKKEPKKSAAI